MAILVVLTAVSAHVVTFLALSLLLGDPRAHREHDRDIEAAAIATRMLEAAPPEGRAELAARLEAVMPHVRYHPPAAALAATPEAGRAPFGRMLGPAFTLVAFDEDGEARVGARLSEGGVVSVSRDLAFGDPPPPRGLPFLLIMATSLVVGVALLSLWAARAVVAPLARFETAVAAFEIGGDDVRLAEEGPIEITRLAQAFNAMRDRIRGMVDDRTRMLAAVGHDLRTPITRLTMRAEDIEQPAVKADIGRDLSLMERMVRSALAFLTTLSAPPVVRRPVDLPALLQTVCDDFADLGADARYDGPTRLRIACDADRVTRAVSNLVDNAVKFGSEARVRLVTPTDQDAAVIVEDRGPGVPEADLERVKGGFVRGDEARTFGERTGGFGLGLAIAAEAAEAHGGALTLENREGGGLRAILHLPRDAADA